jgi:hypothetical protein
MYASSQPFHFFDAKFYRWAGRVTASFLVVAWIILALNEAVRFRFESPSAQTLYQAAALAIVFAGYAIGWRNELVGGVVVIVGTLAFFAVHFLTLNLWPSIEATWFAAPGVLYLFAWQTEKFSGEPLARQK